MSVDEYIDFSLSEKDTLILQSVSGAPRSSNPKVPRTPKKTRLERAPLSGATSAMMQVIKRVRVERLPQYFEQTCDWRPHETAVICGSSQLTYQELDLRANRLAHFLISRGVNAGNPIGILLDRSLDSYIALLAVLKAGAAFVPLDPSFPSDLVAFIAQDAELRGLVTTSAFRAKTRALTCSVLELDLAVEALSVQQETRPEVVVDPASLCYIIYTSGITGQPRGVAVSHANIVNLLRVVTPIYRVMRSDHVYQGMSNAFDFSLAEIWPTWIAGATLVTGPTGPQRFGHGLTEFLLEYKITVLCCTPTLLTTIERDVPSLRSIIIGGEPCPTGLVHRWSRPGRRMLNTYGAAETTVTATWCELFPTRPITIGSPLLTYQVYILDNELHPVEDGKSGEICIGGPGVAIGYHNRPDLTNERFIVNPIWRDSESVPRLYRTGDLGRVTPAGEIEYLGQIEAPAKSLGYRIEHREIEQMALPLSDLILSNGYAATSLPGISAIPEREAETSRLQLLKQWNLKNIYNTVMTDPLYKNSLFNMAGTFMLGGLGFVFWIIVARMYEPDDVGIATTLISIMGLLNSLTVMGLNSSLDRFLPKSTHKTALINSSFVIVTFITLVACGIFLLGLPIFSPQLVFLRLNNFYIISFTLLVVFSSWNMLVESVFKAFRAVENIFMKNTIISVLKIFLSFVFIVFNAYGIFMAVSSSFDIGVFFAVILIIFRFKIRPSLKVKVSLVRETLGYSFANYIVSFMSSMPSLILPVIILNVLSAKYAAYYFVASQIQTLLQVIPLAAASALLVEGAYDEERLIKHTKKAFTTIIVVMFPAIAVIVLAGDLLLQFFGKSYASEAFQFLQLYSAATVFTALIEVSNAIMKVKRQIKPLVIFNVMASLLTLGLSYAFISGKLVGIGWGWMLGQVIAGGVALFFIVRNIYVSKRVR